MTTQEIVREESQALATVPTPMHLIELAVQKGADADQLGKLLDLQLKWEANQQRKAFVAAIEKFKRNRPDINRTKKVSYRNKDGSQTTYSHPELEHACELVTAALLKVGVTHSWRTSDENGKITVTCVFTHKLGHSEDVSTLSGPPDVSGGKNNVQAIGSTVTYLERYTLLAGAGLAVKGTDNDGRTEGMTGTDLDSHLGKIKAAVNIGSLQDAFKEAYAKAKAINDNLAMGTLIQVYNDRKKEFQF